MDKYIDQLRKLEIPNESILKSASGQSGESSQRPRSQEASEKGVIIKQAWG